MSYRGLDLQSGTYDAARALLRKRTRRNIGNNTRLSAVDVSPHDGLSHAYAVTLHSTDIYTMRADGWAVVNTGGWETVTTFARLNALLPAPWRVGSNGRSGNARGVWLYSAGYAVCPLRDGLAVYVGRESDSAVARAADSAVVGYALRDYSASPIETVLTGADVEAIRAAEDAVRATRSAARAARLLREHPTVGGPRTHRGGRWEGWRPYDCARCQAEETPDSAPVVVVGADSGTVRP